VKSTASFQKLLEISPVISRHCNNYLARLVSESRKQLQSQFAQQAVESQSLNTRLQDLVKRQAIAVTENTPILDAIRIMGDEETGSVIVVNHQQTPIGLMTQTDVVRRVILGGVCLQNSIAEVMTVPPAVLQQSATAYDAMLAMAAHGIRHLIIVDDGGKLTGVISERDLFALQRVGLGQVRRKIEKAENAFELKSAMRDIQHTVFNMLAQGVGAEQLTRFISTLNDAITDRVLRLNLAKHDLKEIQWTWLAFGSEGREEQTLSTDQDNGIVYLVGAEQDASALKARLMAFALDVNNDLDTVGFPLCQGEIMASNPKWCMTLEEWQDCFRHWIREPHPDALLNATIFFDFRALFGRFDLAERMAEALTRESHNNSGFLRMLASNAMSATPPLGVIRDFQTEADENGEPFIDLKKFGARIFVDAARVMALANGIQTPSTATRLRDTSQCKGGTGADTEAYIEAFHFIQLMRLRLQHLDLKDGGVGNNRIYIKRLNQLDRRILKEAFKQAKNLQQRLKLSYQL
jgi:CBS domain-containing protein